MHRKWKGILHALLLAVISLLSGCMDEMRLAGLYFGENWVLELGDGYEIQCIDGENRLARIGEDERITVLAKGAEAVRSGEGWLLARGEKDAPYWLIDTTGDVVHGPFAGADAFETACAELDVPTDGAWTSLQDLPEDAVFVFLRIYDEATAWELSTLDYPSAERFAPEDCLYLVTHRDFPNGDGDTFARLRFSPEDGAALEQVLAEEGGWQALPVTGVAANRVNWGLPIDGCYRTTEEHPEFPEVTDGLWHFRNTTPDGDGVRNFELWICDSETATLYYHEYDS